MKKIIGIVPASSPLEANESCMNDFYNLGNNYIKRISEVGCVPIGICPVDNVVSEECLEMCDGFLVQGGSKFYPYHFQIIHYAITHGKRYLGICLGQQLIYVYFELKRRVEEQGYTGDIVTAICDYFASQGPGFSVQSKALNHRTPFPPRGNEDVAKHDVDIVEGTLLHRVLGRNKMRICSFHNSYTPSSQTQVTINAWSANGDGVVEGTEYKDYILGVQGHPEADSLLNELFRFLA